MVYHITYSIRLTRSICTWLFYFTNYSVLIYIVPKVNIVIDSYSIMPY